MRQERPLAILGSLLSLVAFIGSPANSQEPTKNPPIKENSVVFLTLAEEDYARYIAKNPTYEEGLIELLSDFAFYGEELITVLRARGITASFEAGKEISFELGDGSITTKALGQEDVIGLALFGRGKLPILVRRPRPHEIMETATVRNLGDYYYTGKVISEYFKIWLPPYKGQDIAWARIREAFRSYSAAPSPGNAERILASLPNEFDNRNVDQKEWELTLNYLDLMDGKPFRVLENQIRQGDESAIRVAFKTLIITDGAVSEDLLEILSEAIRADTSIFLEELSVLRERNEHSVDFLLRRDSDIDTRTLSEDPPAREAFKKEIILRMRALKGVGRADLIETRDYCLNWYEQMLRELR